MNPTLVVVILTAAAQIGSLLMFLNRWERRITKIETIVGILAAKGGLPMNGGN